MTTIIEGKAFLTTTEAAAKAKVIPQRIRALLAQRRIPGAKRHGPNWMIPDDFSVLPAKKRSRKMDKMPMQQDPPAE